MTCCFWEKQSKCVDASLRKIKEEEEEEEEEEEKKEEKKEAFV